MGYKIITIVNLSNFSETSNFSNDKGSQLSPLLNNVMFDIQCFLNITFQVNHPKLQLHLTQRTLFDRPSKSSFLADISSIALLLPMSTCLCEPRNRNLVAVAVFVLS